MYLNDILLEGVAGLKQTPKLSILHPVPSKDVY